MSTGKVQKAFDLSQEPDALRDAYGRDAIGPQACCHGGLVGGGVTYITMSARWGYFDNHGDTPRVGWDREGAQTICAIDRTLHALVTDLDQRGLLDSRWF